MLSSDKEIYLQCGAAECTFSSFLSSGTEEINAVILFQFSFKMDFAINVLSSLKRKQNKNFATNFEPPER